ncbi:uncharacterized protein MYCFIDRAFT_195907 [Pseudocercospora fijiensis CIRAD86]|uniref:Uncharacterized protein n=1 Tax=Pseudocercospora fijiensis (strain CIRAD86) TaxID=383855 RepID=M3A1H0_PSEFD|nr:uncharacterized protein MYCFIDRAFT_195907 [Pseudocercospora fijiensis CIRAD86]EME85019.1 hypothetical protein MYCFIDRAFT_195907 [Pseudocercospora fijiensis CIRAD86]
MTSISSLLNEPIPKAPQSSPVIATTDKKPAKSLDTNAFSDTSLPDRVVWLQLELAFLKQQMESLERNIALLLSPGDTKERSWQSKHDETGNGHKWTSINSELEDYELDDFMEEFVNDGYDGCL